MKGEKISNGVKQHSFGKAEKIKKSFEYIKVIKQGASHRDGVFILTIFKNKTGRHRLGITVSSSKVRLSSARNRIKRLIREAFRLNKQNLKNGPYDIVVALAKTPSFVLDYSIVEKRLRLLLKKANAL